MTCAERKAMKAKEKKQDTIFFSIFLSIIAIIVIAAIILLPKIILVFFMFPAFLIGALKAGANV